MKDFVVPFHLTSASHAYVLPTICIKPMIYGGVMAVRPYNSIQKFWV
jgi:hypothetical protein